MCTTTQIIFSLRSKTRVPRRLPLHFTLSLRLKRTQRTTGLHLIHQIRDAMRSTRKRFTARISPAALQGRLRPAPPKAAMH
mmetsp:Transcript_30296/g.50148  ORF Transcript_30296/g.50148 Transcript_30296/m.50148 type:complete len:81 (+) Transcript_30296:165-407(+)